MGIESVSGASLSNSSQLAALQSLISSADTNSDNVVSSSEFLTLLTSIADKTSSAVDRYKLASAVSSIAGDDDKLTADELLAYL
jgi:hypothetical protein